MNIHGHRLRACLAIVAALAAIAAAPRAANSGDDGRSAMSEAWKRVRGVHAELETLDVFVISQPDKPAYEESDVAALRAEGRRGIVRKRAVRSIQYAEDGHDKLHVVFSEPAEDRGTALLVWRQPSSSQDDQWLYLSALKRVRRLPASSTQTFAGSDLSYEDMRNLTSEPLERFDYEIVGDETVDGQPCTLIRATPHSDATSAYARRDIAIAKQSLFPVRTSFRDSKGVELKVLRAVGVREVAPGLWRPAMIEMRDLRIGESTVVAFVSRDINPEFAPALFTQDHLERSLGQ
jgi:uncharacterized protein